MVDTKHVEPIETGITAFDQLVQDIREIREIQDSRSLLHRRARSAESELPPEEKLPLFLSTPDEQETAFPPATPQQSAPEQSPSHQNTFQQSSWRRSAPQQDVPLQEARYQDARYQDAQYPDTQYQDIQDQDTWLRDALEMDSDRVEAEATPSVLKRVVKAGFLTTTVLAALAALFALEDGRSLISNASASLAAVLPGFSAGIIRPAPAKPQVAEKITATAPTSVATVAVTPTREAIASAYQTALQSQPDVRQVAVAQPAPVPPPPAPAARRLDPDELAGLLKRAQGMLDTGDLLGARLLLERAADAHEAQAAYLLAQTYDPAVLGTQDARSLAPDPAAAKRWYGKAAEFGSQEARQRLAQMN